jgi:RNA recognition motif-containing protein
MMIAQYNESTAMQPVVPLMQVSWKNKTCKHSRKRPFECIRSPVFAQTLAKAVNSVENVRDSHEDDLRKPDGSVPFNAFLVNELYSSTSHPERGLLGLKMASDKQGCCIFVKNLPRGVSPQIVVQFLNRAIYRSGLSTSSYKPVVRCRMSGNFAFVVCASMEDANKAMELDGVSLLGSKLRISSSSRYVSRGDKSGMSKGLLEGSNMRGSNVKVVNNVSLISDKPTRVLVLDNVVSYEDLDEDEDYIETLIDVKDECSQYGSLSKIYVPRFGVYATKIFLEYKSVDDAVNAHEKLNNRTFDERIVTVEFGDVECLDYL